MHLLSAAIPYIPFLNHCMHIFSTPEKGDFFWNCTTPFSMWHFIFCICRDLPPCTLWKETESLHWGTALTEICATHHNAYSQLFSGPLFRLPYLKVKPKTTLVVSINIYKFQHYQYSFSWSFSKVNQAHFQCKNVQILQAYVNICAN